MKDYQLNKIRHKLLLSGNYFPNVLSYYIFLCRKGARLIVFSLSLSLSLSLQLSLGNLRDTGVSVSPSLGFPLQRLSFNRQQGIHFILTVKKKGLESQIKKKKK